MILLLTLLALGDGYHYRVCDNAGETAYDRPPCAEYEQHKALLDAFEAGDRNALPRIQAAWKRTESHYGRHRLARVLLGRVADAAIWRELETQAAMAVMYPSGDYDPPPAFVAWCAKRGVTAEEYWEVALDALETIAPDQRSAPLLTKALDTRDARLIKAAIIGFGRQRNETMLPHIDRALATLLPGQRDIAFALAEFASPAADAVAARYLDEAERWAYEQSKTRQ